MIAFQNLTLVIDGSPKVIAFAVDLHERLVPMLAPTARLQTLDPAPPDFGGEQRSEPVPPEPYGFATDINAAFVEKILDVAQRERKGTYSMTARRMISGLVLK